MRTQLGILSLALLLATPVPGSSSLCGYCLDDLGRGVYEVCVFVNQYGSGWNGYYSTQPNGYFTISGLEAGQYYTACAHDPFHFRSRIVTGIQGLGSGLVYQDLPLHMNYTVRDDIWDETGYREYGQTFVASGYNIIKISVRNAGTAKTINVSVHEDGPGGPQVGPVRSCYCGHGGRDTCSWNAGEVPTIPGHLYYVKAEADDGGVWNSCLDSDGASYPDGMAYYNGTPQPLTDLSLHIDSDDDGYISTVNTRYRGGGDFANEFGQTFVANTQDIITASAVVGADGEVIMEFSILDAPGGSQIGPAKVVRGWGNDARGCCACWGPGEVPVTPGLSYYLRVRRQDHAGVYVYFASNTYSGGSLYVDGVAETYLDLNTRIMGRITDMPSLGMASVSADDIENTSATITWTTTAPAMSQVLVWADGDEANATHTTLDETMVTNHSVALAGLTHNTLYHYIAKSYAPGYEYAASAEQTFTTAFDVGTIAGHVVDENWADLAGAEVVTVPGGFSDTTDTYGDYAITDADPGTYDVVVSKQNYASQTLSDIEVTAYQTSPADSLIYALPSGNLLTNPGFETGNTTGWTATGDGVVFSGTWFGGIQPYEGTYAFGKAVNGGAGGFGGYYQRIAASSGLLYTFGAWSCVYWESGSYIGTSSRIGIDPTGGTDKYSGNIVWSPRDYQYTQGTWEWEYLSVSATAQASYVTVFITYDQQSQGGNEWHVNCYDACSLTTAGGIYTSPVGWFGLGWNLMSVPAEPGDPAADAALRSLAGAANTIDNALFRYDKLTGYEIFPGGFANVECGRAYWLYLDAMSATCTVHGSPRADGLVPLSDGWTMLGHPWPDPVAWATCQITDGVETKSIADAETAGWIQADAFYYDGGYLTVQPAGGDDDSLRPWYGYWLLANQAGLTLIVPQP